MLSYFSIDFANELLYILYAKAYFKYNKTLRKSVNGLPKPKKLKRAIIKEELVSITGDAINALLLQQFIYWSERVEDCDKFLKQENEIMEKNGERPYELLYGWIYKTAEELSEETMLGLSASNMRNRIKALVSLGYIEQRNNPIKKWDRTLQYRVNLYKIITDLNKNGYHLEGYSGFGYTFSETENGNSDSKNGTSETKIGNFETENATSQNEKAIPETTTDNTSENTNKDNNISAGDVRLVISKWNELTDFGMRPIKMISVNSERYHNLNARVRETSLDAVLEAIERIKHSDYLQGKVNRWKADFDWFVQPGSFQKVLEGKYDNKFEKRDVPSEIEDIMKDW